MYTEIVRINVIIPKDLMESINEIAGPRMRSRLVTESLREYIRRKKEAELATQLEEGYRASAKENITLAREFGAADLEGWDEY